MIHKILFPTLALSWCALAQPPALKLLVEVRSGLTAESAFDVRTARKEFAAAPPALFRTIRCGAECPRFMATPQHQGPGFAPPNPLDQYLVDWQPNGTLEVMLAPEPAPNGLKVLPWASAEGSGILMVSADGAVFRGMRQALSEQPAAPSVTNRYASLFPADVKWLEQHKLLPAGSSDQLTTALDAANACARKFWDKAEPEFKKLEATNLTDETRENRMRQLSDKTQVAVDKACSKQVEAVEKVMDALITRRLAP